MEIAFDNELPSSFIKVQEMLVTQRRFVDALKKNICKSPMYSFFHI